MDFDGYYHIGYIKKTHGLNGYLSVALDVDFPEDYATIDSLFINVEGNLVPYTIKSISISDNKAIISLHDVLDNVEAKQLVGLELWMPIEFLKEKGSCQFFYHELVGCEVHCMNKGKLGSINKIYDVQDNCLMALTHQGKEVLLPTHADILKKVDKDKKLIYVQLPEGLIDIYMEA